MLFVLMYNQGSLVLTFMNTKHAAAIIIRDRKILLIRRSEKEDSEPNKWCVVNETLEDDESPENAVVRGVYEEIGLKFEITKRLFEHSYQGHITYLFTGTASGDFKPNLEEVAEYKWFFHSEAKKLEFAYDYGKVISGLHDLGLIAD